MSLVSNKLNRVKLRRQFPYEKLVPTLVSNNTGISDEIARWVLDINSILYKNEGHVAGCLARKVVDLTGKEGMENCPVLQMTDALVYDSGSIVRFFEQRCTPQNRLLPTDEAACNEVIELYHLFTGEFFEAKVSRYMYGQLLASPKFAVQVLKQQAPFFEKLKLTFGYSFIKKAIIDDFHLAGFNAHDNLIEIRKIFAKVDAMLADGRRYLSGEQFTLADLAFAAIAAPLVLPEEFGGVLPHINQVPDDYRNEVFSLRATQAGQFVLRIYLEHRPGMHPQAAIPKESGFLGKLFTAITVSMGRKKYKLFYFLQKRYPILRLSLFNLVLVNRHELVVDVLERDNDFTIEEINAKKMSAQKGAFFLGMDRNNPQFDRERNFVRKATKRDDLEMIRTFIRETSTEIINNAAPFGKLDVSNSFARVIIVRLLDFYFGTPSPTEAIMMDWNKVMFYDLFLNFTNNAKKHKKALEYGIQRRDWLLQVIKERRRLLKEGHQLADNLFNRMIIMAMEPGNEWADDDVLQRNIGGLLTGIQEGTNKSLILILDELFNRPAVLGAAIDVAHSGDMNKMYGYVSEALRFNPTQPGVIRYSETKQIIAGKGTRQYVIKPKTTVMTLTSCAMFDPAAFPDPETFQGDRTATYMNYGYALHECYGKYINAVTLSEFTAAILRLKNVRREPGRIGVGMGLTDGPFPVNYVVQFD